MAARLFVAFCLLPSVFLWAQRPARTPDIHFTPTRHMIADAMLQLAEVGPDDVVCDLGSGDGRIPIIAAQKYGATGTIVGDLFEADISQATVVTAYLSPSIMKMLEPRLRALKPGTRIVSHQFPMTGWKPDKRVQIEESELLLWRVAK